VGPVKRGDTGFFLMGLRDGPLDRRRPVFWGSERPDAHLVEAY
jgi:hypothetical protein